MAEIQHRLRIDAPLSDTVSLVSTAHGFSQWWSEDAEPLDDGRVRLGFFNRSTIYDLRRVTKTPVGTIAWVVESGREWDGTRIIFELAPIEGGTALAFKHSAWVTDTDYFYSCNTVWGGLMLRLKAAAEGRGVGPHFTRSSTAY